MLFALLAGTATAASPRLRAGETAFCSVRPPIEFSVQRTRGIVHASQVIVLATAIGAVPPPPGSTRPDLRYMAFEVREILKGTARDTLRFVGYPDERDSFSDEPPPYLSYFRWHGGGDCMATTYKPGGEYLLILGDSEWAGMGLSPYWQILAPTNDQVRGPDDPWVRWVRRVLAEGALAP